MTLIYFRKEICALARGGDGQGAVVVKIKKIKLPNFLYGSWAVV